MPGLLYNIYYYQLSYLNLYGILFVISYIFTKNFYAKYEYSEIYFK